MERTPKSLRLHIGIFGRTNVGKSSFLNMVTGQAVAITSPLAGTTTDVVEKTMELLPLGPVLFLDTAGIDDTSALAGARLEKTRRTFHRADIVVLIVEPDTWTEYEEKIIAEAEEIKLPVIIVVNKADTHAISAAFREHLGIRASVMACSSTDLQKRDEYVHEFKKLLIGVCPDDFVNPRPLIADLIPRGGLAFFVVPIDLEAPKGRIILPQVQSIRDTLDSDAAAMVVKEHEITAFLGALKTPPHLVVCDSQAVLKVVSDVPPSIPCTTFSILFARAKGDLVEMARGVRAFDDLKAGDQVLVAESCTHHAIEDDIGRVKIPRWIKEYTGVDVQVTVCSGQDYPEDLRRYRLVIQCGGCMLNRRAILYRIERARQEGVPITNYGVAIAYLQGVLDRVLSPFPDARAAAGKSELR